MILGHSFRDQTTSESPFRRMTLDDLFRRAVERHGDAVALIDPPDRESFTDGPPRRLTYGEADRIISAIASRLIELGLKTDAVVALQLPNTVESVLTLLGVLRAGMIAVPLPLLWRQLEAVQALSRIGARALITASRIGAIDHGELAMHVAAETFTVRFLCAFGEQHLDGVVALDDVFAVAAVNDVRVERVGNPADHVAAVTFEITSDGLVPVARSHAELIAGGLAVSLDGRIGHDVTILGTLTTTSFAGLATVMMPWLLGGGTLALHHPFSGVAFATQCRQNSDIVVVPGPLLPRLAETDLLAGRRGATTILSVWRSPERAAGSPPWPDADTALLDVLAFGEAGLVTTRRREGKPVALTPGPTLAHRPDGDGLALVHVRRTPAGTVALSGAMVPHSAFPPNVERSGVPRLRIGDDGTVDTGYGCRLDRPAGTLTINAPPAGIVSVGGYRFVLRDLQQFVTDVAEGSTLAALPDGLAGHRLAGVAIDRDSIRRVLAGQGANPLIVGAFRERRADRASAA